MHWKQKLFQALILVSCISLTGAPAWSQMVSGTFVGTVSDETGGVLPGVTITVTHLSRNQSWTTVTDDTGSYVIPNLPLGVYSLSAELIGFRAQLRSGFTLEVDQRVRVNFTLQVGDITDVVRVESTTQLVRSETSELGEVIGERQVEELPLNARNFVQLVTLTAGTGTGFPGQSLHGNSPSAFRSNTAVSTNSGRADQNNFLLDGVDNNEADVNTIVILPIIDAIQEFKVLTNSFSAEYGRTAGAVISIQTKSGSNDFHGNLFQFHRNSALDAKNFFDPAGPIPKFIQNQFGGTLGGPLVKDRTFFFGAYQGTRIRQSNTFISTVPTARMKQGDFSELPFPVRHPLTGIPFAGNIIPPSEQDPAAAALLETYPEPNRPGAANNFVNNPLLRRDDDQFDIRIDHRFSDSRSFFARYSLNHTDRFQPSILTGTSAPAGGESFTGIVGPLSGAGDADLTTQGVAINHTWVASSSLINETRLGFTRFALFNVPEGFGRNIADEFGIPGINISELTTGMPRLQIAGFAGLGPASFLPDISNQNMYQIVNNVTWIRGGHTFKFGVDFRKRERNNYETFNQQGVFLFTPRFTNHGMADFLTGYPTTTLRTLLHGPYGKRSWEFAAFSQNDLTVSPRFKLNLGLRWEIFAPVYEHHLRSSNFDPTTGNMILASDPGDLGRALRRFHKNNLGPRIGLAYDLFGTGQTIIRAGFGISFLEDGGQVVTLNLADNYPFAVTQVIPTFTNPINRLSEGLSVPIVPAPNPTRPSGNIRFVDHNFKPGYTQMWTLNLQHALADDLLLDLAYAGSSSVRQRVTRNINQPLPGPGPAQTRRPFFSLNPALVGVTGAFSDGLANFHSFQAKMNKRFSRNLAFLATYTWSKTISMGGGALSLCADAGPENPNDLRAERSVSCTDIPHRFVFSYNYALPFGEDLTGMAAALGRGWQVNGITQIRSGSPFTPKFSTNNPEIGVSTRPDRICDGKLPKSQRTPERFFDTSCFVEPAGVFGNSGRNILRGPGQVNFDLSLFKNFLFSETTRLQFRTEFFNIFNKPQFQLPVRFIDTADGATIRETVNTSRQIQLALKLYF